MYSIILNSFGVSELSQGGTKEPRQESEQYKPSARAPPLHRCEPAVVYIYGDDLDGAVGRLYQAVVSMQVVGDYQMSNVSILVHKYGSSPSTNGEYMVRNRMMGQIDGANIQSCSKARCEETLRPFPCACAGGGSWHVLLPQPRQVHVVSHTRSYAMVAVLFSPEDAFVANCKKSMEDLWKSTPLLAVSYKGIFWAKQHCSHCVAPGVRHHMNLSWLG